MERRTFLKISAQASILPVSDIIEKGVFGGLGVMNMFFNRFQAASTGEDKENLVDLDSQCANFFDCISGNCVDWDPNENQHLRDELRSLMQTDVIGVNLYFQQNVLGYTALDDALRQLVYQRLQQLTKIFSEIPEKCARSSLTVKLKKLGIDEDKRNYVHKILDFINTHVKTCGQNPRLWQVVIADQEKFLERQKKHKKLPKGIGDCTNKTTLFLHLYAQRYSLSDLRLRFFQQHLPGQHLDARHLALSINGQTIDPSTTNGLLDESAIKSHGLNPYVYEDFPVECLFNILYEDGVAGKYLVDKQRMNGAARSLLLENVVSMNIASR